MSGKYDRVNQKENKNGLTISTIHSVKGLEFPYVFLVGLEENIFPNSFKFESDSELEEERRVAYVACTRAQKKLYLVKSNKRMLYGNFFKNEPSRFLFEFIGRNAIKEKKKVIVNDFVCCWCAYFHDISFMLNDI